MWATTLRKKISVGLITLSDPGTGATWTIDHGDPEEERKTLATLLAGSPIRATGDPCANLDDAWAEYKQEKRDGGSWTTSTEMEQDRAYELFSRIAKETGKGGTAGALSNEAARNYLNTLKKLPVNLNSTKAYEGKTIPEILKLAASAKKLEFKTINKQTSMINAFMRWAEKRGYVSKNYYSGLTLNVPTKAKEERFPFTDEDLERIFSNTPSLKEAGARDAWKHWLPLLGFYTGCRIEELCQLHKEDVKEQDGIRYFDINRRVKTESSRRKVPVHYGLSGFVAWLQAQPGGPLFPYLKPDKKGNYSAAPSKWFGRLKDKWLDQPEKKAFHSFRHTFSERLKMAGVGEKVIGALMGHTDNSMTTGRYGSGEWPLDQLKKGIDYL